MLAKFLAVIALVIGSISVLRPCLAAPPKLEEVELAGKKLAGGSTSGANPSFTPVIAEEVSPLESEPVEQSLAMSEMGMDHGKAPESKEPAEIQALESDLLEPTQDIVAPGAHGPVEGRDIHGAKSFRSRAVIASAVFGNALIALGWLSRHSLGVPENHLALARGMLINIFLFNAWVFGFKHHWRD